MYQRYQDIIAAIDLLTHRMNQIVRDRDELIELFDSTLGDLRLSMRLRRRSGGMIAWRNIAKRGRDQRHKDLAQYRDKLDLLPQPVKRQLLDFEKQRILINLNISIIQHEKAQLILAAEKIEANIS